MNMLVALEGLNRILGELDGKALDEAVLMSDLAALVNSVLLSRLDLFVGGVLLAGNDVRRHVGYSFVMKVVVLLLLLLY
jgi:hypothetical protein